MTVDNHGAWIPHGRALQVFYMEHVTQLLEPYDHNQPLLISDNLWWVGGGLGAGGAGQPWSSATVAGGGCEGALGCIKTDLCLCGQSAWSILELQGLIYSC
jgi:hypothetical protein